MILKNLYKRLSVYVSLGLLIEIELVVLDVQFGLQFVRDLGQSILHKIFQSLLRAIYISGTLLQEVGKVLLKQPHHVLDLSHILFSDVFALHCFLVVLLYLDDGLVI